LRNLIKKILLEDYYSNKATKRKDPIELKKNGWVKIPLKSGRPVKNVLHVTNKKGLDYIKNNLGKIQISTFNKGKIGKMGDILLVLNGVANKSFDGDAGTVVDSEGVRWYKPDNVATQGMYNEIILVPKEIVDVIDISDLKDFVEASDYVN